MECQKFLSCTHRKATARSFVQYLLIIEHDYNTLGGRYHIYFGYGDVPSERVSIFMILVSGTVSIFAIFAIGRVGYAFSENWYKVGYLFVKN